MSKGAPLIAIVDDDASVCRAMKRLVRSLGMNAETFASGQEFVDCLEAMPSFHPDCAILDVQMPGMSGLELQEWLAHSQRPFPVLFITAHDEVGVRERALAMGAVAFLRKPFNDELFAKTLRAALNTGTEET
jgi:FixJ family two-component response regulator